MVEQSKHIEKLSMCSVCLSNVFNCSIFHQQRELLSLFKDCLAEYSNGGLFEKQYLAINSL